MKVTLRYFDGCPNWRATGEMLAALGAQHGFGVVTERVETPEQADAIGFRGSPTVLIDGADPFTDPTAPIGLACRVYRGPDGLIGAPTEPMLRAAFEAAAP